MDPASYLAGVIALGVLAQWAAWRLRVPAILFLLIAGVLGGYVASPDDILGRDLVQPIVSLFVAVVLFEGGLTLRLGELRETRIIVLRLISCGALITWGLATLAGLLVFSDVRVAALAGAIYTVTGPTVIGPMLRAIRPRRTVGSVAKWEGIVIDPIGALLAVLVFEATLSAGPGAALTQVVLAMLKTIAISAPLAAVAGGLFVLLLRRHWLPDHLQVPAMLGTVLVVHVVSNAVQEEAGLATVTLLGMILANQKFARLEHVAEFKEHLTTLLISTLFILLAGRLDPLDVVALGWQGVAFLALLVLVVRPASIFGSLLGSGMKWQEQAFLAWLAPRGIVAVAVSAVFALHARHYVEAGQLSETTAEEMRMLVSLTFLVVIGTVAVYGLTSGIVARRLGVAEPDPQGVLFLGANRVSIAIAEALHAAEIPVLLVDTNRGHVNDARMKGLPVAYGNALFESFQENLGLGGIGRMLAMTPNDEVNTLATLEYADLFGRSEVYQLSGERKATEHDEKAGKHRARGLFAGHLDYDTLDARLANGATIKRTALTEEFTLERFREMYGETAEILFVRGTAGKLTIVTTTNDVVPRAGQTVFALVDPAAAETETGTTA